MDIFNNREIATGVWLIIFIAFLIVLNKDRKSLVKPIIGILKILTHYKIFFILALMVGYIVLSVYFLIWIGVWEQNQLKNTIFWGLSVALILLFRANEIEKESDFFKKLAADNLRLLVVLEFVIGFYTFSFWIEMILVPIFAITGIMLAVAKHEKQLEPLKRVLNGMLIFFGLGLIVFALYKLVTDFQSFANLETLADFSIPPLLTLLYFPFLYAISLLFLYENVFVRMHSSIKCQSIRSYARRKALLSFHVRANLLKRWSRNLLTRDTDSTEDIDNSIKEVFIERERENNPIKVPFENGWSPYIAKYYLKSEGIVTSDYRRSRSRSNGWFSDSPYLTVGEGIFKNNIIYYVEGNETAATNLRVVINVNYPNESEEVKSKFLNVCRLLYNKALGLEMPLNMGDHIKSELEINAELKGKNIKLRKKYWEGDTFGGYNITFEIGNQIKEQD